MAATWNVLLRMDAHAFRAWAHLMHHRSDEPLEDAMVAATAEVHGLTVVTRNLRDFVPFGVPTLDPFAGQQACPVRFKQRKRNRRSTPLRYAQPPPARPQQRPRRPAILE